MKTVKEVPVIETRIPEEDEWWFKMMRRMNELYIEAIKKGYRDQQMSNTFKTSALAKGEEPVFDPWEASGLADREREAQLMRKIMYWAYGELKKELKKRGLLDPWTGPWPWPPRPWPEPDPYVTDFVVDFTETDEVYIVEAELAGVAKKDVVVTYTEGVLRIAAVRPDNKKYNGALYRHELKKGKLERHFVFEDVQKSKIDVVMSNGILKVVLPKAKIPKDEMIPIK